MVDTDEEAAGRRKADAGFLALILTLNGIRPGRAESRTAAPNDARNHRGCAQRVSAPARERGNAIGVPPTSRCFHRTANGASRVPAYLCYGRQVR